jgi:HAD superfamily hydrolase (TIGR01509 family)
MVEEMARAVLFDVDGTLLDTNYLHVLAWSRAFREHNEWASMASIHALIGMGSDKFIARTLGGARPDLNEAHSRHYADLRDDAVAFPGAQDLLRETARRGWKVALGTSAKGDEVDSILDRLQARDVIDTIVSSADVERSKPDPDIFEEALRRAGAGAEGSLVIGDTVWDIQAARRCGLRCVAVTTGGIAREVLAQAGAAEVYESVAEVLTALDQVLGWES